MTTTISTTQIEELRNQVKLADTSTNDGRQTVANSCAELYSEIEEALYNQYGEASIKDAFNDLTKGDFSAPYMCELKKNKFELYYRVYTQNCNK